MPSDNENDAAQPDQGEDISQRKNQKPWSPPQNAVDKLWSRFAVKISSSVTAVLPALEAAGATPPQNQGEPLSSYFQEAADICKQRVDKISEEYRRIKERYRDPHFDIDFDLKRKRGICLGTLLDPTSWALVDLKAQKLVQTPWSQAYPKSVQRVHKIFDGKQTFSPGSATPHDIRQGDTLGNCWLMSSLTVLATIPGLIEHICVARDERVGVYGFLFYRDGEWKSTIIDDNLYLSAPDWDSESFYGRPYPERTVFENMELPDKETEYIKLHQRGSRALWGGHCRSGNETWLPLLEKAFAKAHGDYYSLVGGWPGEGLEDLTGGVTTELLISDILDDDDFWENELKKNLDLKDKAEILFSCTTGILDSAVGETRGGIREEHTYTIMAAKQLRSGEKLLLIRNPWGTLKEGLWDGAWSDGSKEWTPETLSELNHKQGIDSEFWILYEDFLRKFQVIDRTHLFMDPGWRLAQQWSSVAVPWGVMRHQDKFHFTVKADTAVVLVLSQLDDRYFNGLEGQYMFKLYFRLHPVEKTNPQDYLARSHGNLVMDRSVTTELSNLRSGTYSAFVQVLAKRLPWKKSVEEVVSKLCRDKDIEANEKLYDVGRSYNMAHAKGSENLKKHMRARVKEEKRKHEREYRRNRARMLKQKRQTEMPSGIPLEATFQKPEPSDNTEKDTKNSQADAPKNLSTTMVDSALAISVLGLIKTESPLKSTLPENPLSQTQPFPIDAPTESIKTTSDQVTITEKIPMIPSKYNESSSSASDSDSDPEYQHEKLQNDLANLSYETSKFDDEIGDQESSIDPWNAVCMIGLRVYSKDPDLRITVVEPGKGEKTGLDLDDKLANMTGPPTSEAKPERGGKDEIPFRLKVKRSSTSLD